MSAAYEARRALPANEDDVLDDLQRLQVALERLATDWTAIAAVNTGPYADASRTHARQLRDTLRRHR